ncbi:MAG: ABC transporter permease [Pseudomonadota bacterium]
MLLRLAIGSLRARALTVCMTVLAIALSVALFLGVEKVRNGAKASFFNTISDTDLIVGARSGSVQLLLYSVFRIGNATDTISWQAYKNIVARPDVAWAVPISLGDSHRQFRVMGTTRDFFDRYKFRGGQSLTLAEGELNSDLFDAVIGADVAESLGYSVDTEITVAHGLVSFTEHADQPFRVSGILSNTGTPVDRTVIVSLEAIEAIHVDWRNGARVPGVKTPVEDIRSMDLTPNAVTAVYVGVESPLRTLALQRAINDYSSEPLLAILPGVALQELWGIIGVAENALLAVSTMVVFTALLCLMATMFSSLNERRREMAICRAMGARPRNIVGFLVLEAVLTATVGAVLGVALLYFGLAIAQPVIDRRFGLWLPLEPLSLVEYVLLSCVILAGAIVSLLPAWRAYRLSLADGMNVRT